MLVIVLRDPQKAEGAVPTIVAAFSLKGSGQRAPRCVIPVPDETPRPQLGPGARADVCHCHTLFSFLSPLVFKLTLVSESTEHPLGT